ncbi:HD domain-containing protein [Leptospira ilyithenensis]|uniref:bis(5'-nucleosyl)-tetraphosphatase (symmetrical) n=2 Tax=Leptospira ilyithenensis TaxID=2484901 RepID=A0A4R9LRF2_9LEPT|nr:HD domain-containing protein [Leptospira ilyithenensis]
MVSNVKMKTIKDWIPFFLKKVPQEITQTRWEHCLRVANHAEKLANIHKLENPKKAYLAGILHDITKQKKYDFHISLFETVGFPNWKEIPKEAYHAFTAPIFIQKEFGFSDEEVFSAMQCHTLGGKNLTLIQKILYASDFLGSEYAEKQDRFKEWKEKTEENLEFGVYLKASKTIANLMETESTIHPYTIETYNQTIPNLNFGKK